jgi:predicted PurR-regulated permease PerM
MWYTSVWHWVIVGIALAVLGYPIARILKRLGFSRWWVVVALFPYLNVVGLWILAFVRWPVERR